MNGSFSELFYFRFTSTFLASTFKRSPHSHDNIPSILSKNLCVLRGLRSIVTAITTQRTSHVSP